MCCMALRSGVEKVQLPGGPIRYEVRPIIDSIAGRGEPGWFRCTTDLLGLAGETQTRLVKGFRECCRGTSADGNYHDMLVSFAGGMWGHPTVFVGIAPETENSLAHRDQLSQYVRVKGYQLQADRAYGLLFSAEGDFLELIYLTNPPHSDPGLDRLVVEMGPQPVGRASRPTP